MTVDDILLTFPDRRRYEIKLVVRARRNKSWKVKGY